jgi:hypothetical protein
MRFAKHGASLRPFCAGWKLTPVHDTQVAQQLNTEKSIKT